MNDREINDILQSQRDAPDPTLLAGIAASIASKTVPVRPLPASSMLASGLLTLCAIAPCIIAAILGFQGVRQLGNARIGVIFSILLVFTILAATLSVSGMIPGSRRVADPRMLLTLATLVTLSAFGLAFHDPDMTRFLSRGLKCLAIGLVTAAFTSLGCWFILRRGFAVNPAMAGLATGTLAGLAGVIALELHCPIFAVMHVTVWHTAVIPVSACLGTATGLILARK
jgi:hypothetical protein